MLAGTVTDSIAAAALDLSAGAGGAARGALVPSWSFPWLSSGTAARWLDNARQQLFARTREVMTEELQRLARLTVGARLASRYLPVSAKTSLEEFTP